MSDEIFNAILRRHAGRILSLPDVVGVVEGETDGGPCIRVFVSRKTEELLSSIPRELEGWPVIVEETGEFRAFNGT